MRERSAAAEAGRQKREAELRDQLEADYRARLEEIEARLDRERRERVAAETRAAEARAEAERRAAEARANAARNPPGGGRPRCVVADPSSTPLNVRASPGNTGKVIGTLKDGHVVFVLREYPRGRPWAYVADTAGGGLRELGWVYRPYIRC